MSQPVIVAVVEDNGVRAYRRNGDRQLHQTAMLAIGSEVGPEVVAAIVADLGDALGWDRLDPPPPPPVVKRPRRALPAASRPPQAKRSMERIQEEVERLASVVRDNDGPLQIPILSRLLWRGEEHTSATYQRTLNRLHRAERAGLVTVYQDTDGVYWIEATRHPVNHPEPPGEG